MRRPPRSAADVAQGDTRIFLRRWSARTSHLLEVGCGTGAALAHLARNGVVVTGAEADPVAVAAARARGLEVVAGGAEDVRGGPFAVVAFAGSLRRAPSLERALDAARRLLEDGAILLVEDLAPERLDGRAAAWWVEAEARLAAAGFLSRAPAAADGGGALARLRAGPGGEAIRAAVAARFDVLEEHAVPYLYRDLAVRVAGGAADGPAAARGVAALLCEERRRVREGDMPAVGVRIVAVKR